MAVTISGTGGLTFNDGTTQSNGGSQSIATSGYQKLPSGVIIQWVLAGTTTSTSGTIAFTWPVAFASACYAALPACNIQDSGEIGSSKSTTGGTIDFFGFSSSSKTFVVVGIGV